MSVSETAPPSAKALGFWSCWALTVGIMIGSGVFILPSVLAPYGMMSFAGWILTASGSLALALVIARLSSRTTRTGGVYVYAQDAFGDLTGFLIAWGYWAAYWISIPAIAIAFVGYLAVFFPVLETSLTAQASTALALIWGLTLINIKGVKEAGFVQLLMTVLKLIPLIIIIAYGFSTGSNDNLPPVNPTNGTLLSVLASTAILTMWAFSGLEAGAIPAGDVENPERTIPRAIVVGTLTVTFVYIASTYAVMRLVPAEELINSVSPFADAAKSLGTWGPYLIALGAAIATAGALNGVVFIIGQMPMALAIDGLAPQGLARRNKNGAPHLAILLGSTLASLLLLMNYSKGLIGAFTFLAIMSTLSILVPLLVSAAAELKHSWANAKAWGAVALLSGLYSVFAILGSGLASIGWGLLLFAFGLPVYYQLKKQAASA